MRRDEQREKTGADPDERQRFRELERPRSQ
jgi:hypothetical protein